jgi:hypothetical protein
LGNGGYTYSEAVDGIIVTVVKAALERGVIREYGYSEVGVCIQVEPLFVVYNELFGDDTNIVFVPLE